MEKLKQAISRNKDDGTTSTEGTSGNISGGQGSHFASARETSSTHTGNENLGSTTTSSDPQTIGTSDRSAVQPDPRMAAYTAGPEAGGQSHVGTTGTTISSYGQDGGAAIGNTSTYSTTHLTKGDPLPSVVDSTSRDPVTYQKPEAPSHRRDVGVPEGSAQTAAVKAFNGHSRGEGMPGAFPTAGYENPYKAENLDPRVDGLPIRGKDDVSSSTAPHTTSATGAALGAGTLAGAGAATAVGDRELSHQTPTQTETTAPAPSALASTVNPADRSADYSQAENNKGLGNEPQEESMVGKVLGAMGLGGLLGAGAGAAATQKDESAVDTSAEGPLTTTGTESYRSSSQSGPPAHHRKESIPTTAYPAGPDSVRPIAAPVGGTRPAIGGTDVRPAEDRDGRDAAIGAGVVGGGGAAALGGYEFEKSRQPESITGQTSNIAPTAGTTTQNVGSNDPPFAMGGSPSSPMAPVAHGQESVHHATTTEGATPIAAVPVADTSRESALPREEKEDHTGRNTALAGVAGAGVIGAGAYAANEHSEKEAARQAAEREKERARQQKELEHQRAAHAKELEKEQKAHEKEAAKEQKAQEKEIEKQEKAAAKEQKAREKEIEKEEKAAAKEQKKAEKENVVAGGLGEQQQSPAALADEREQARLAAEGDHHRGAELGAAGVGAGAAGAGLATHESDKHRQDAGAAGTGIAGNEGVHQSPHEQYPNDPLKWNTPEKEKKPSLLKRIFRRKNKDTGEDEEYEAEEEEKHHYGGATAAGVGGAGAAGTAAYAATHDDSTHQPSTYEEKSGGFVKPSYNPFTHKDQPDLAGTGDINNTGRHAEPVREEHGLGTTSGTPPTVGGLSREGRTAEPIPHESSHGAAPVAGSATGGLNREEPIGERTPHDSGLGTTSAGGVGADGVATKRSLDSSEHHERNRLHKDPPVGHPAAQQSTSGPGGVGEPRESITDLPYDPAKDPSTAARLEQHQHGAGMGEGTSAARRLEQEEAGEGHKKSIGEKIKDKLGMGHHEDES